MIETTTMELYEGEQITDDLVAAAAELFSQNYGVWGALAAEKMGVKEGARVKMTPKKLKEQILPPGAEYSYARMFVEENLAGNVFATRWKYYSINVLWITQLCVHKNYRNIGIAKELLQYVSRENDHCVGILSSHPFAISAILRVFGPGLESMDLQLTSPSHTGRIMESSPIAYVRNAKVRGSLFQDGRRDEEGAVSCADTKFLVDHSELQDALQLIEEKGLSWPFGALPEGHEFLYLLDQQLSKR